jgi:Uma2 family endonuclease
MAIVYDRENEIDELDELEDWADDEDLGYPPVVPGLDNSTLPRDLLAASQRPKGPYTFQNAFDLLNDHPLELLNGWLVWDKMTDFDERTFAHNVQMILDLAARSANFGQAYPDQIECELKDGTVIKPDVCVVSNTRRIAKVVSRRSGRRKRKILIGGPDLAVELRSPSNTRDTDAFKRGRYFDNATPIVWDIDPRQKFIQVWRASDRENCERFNIGDTITCELFPGWSRPVADFFSVGYTNEQMLGQVAVDLEARGEAKGKIQGEIAALRRMLPIMLKMRFGGENLPEDLTERVKSYNLEQMELITSTIATSPTLQDWIANMPPASENEG